MKAYNRWLLGGALILGSACSPRDSAVKTTTDDGTTASPSGEAVAQRDNLMIRVVNANTSGPAVSLLADERVLFEKVAATEVTAYKELDDNAVRFSVRPSDQPSAAGESVNREVMADGQRYTAVVLPDDQGAATGLRVLHDDLAPASGKARIRVVHAAVGTGEVDVAIAGHSEDLFSGVNFGMEAGYKDIDPTAGTLEVRRKNEQLRLAQVKNMKLEAGTAYTVVIVGGPKTPLKAITFADEPVAASEAVGLVP